MLSVIVPTLNAGLTLGRSLASVADSDLVGEIIVADGGSTDDSTAIADRFEAIVVSSEAGRGQQLAAGAAIARYDWLLFLHGDSVLEASWKAAAASFMEAPSEPSRAGYFTLKYDVADWRARLLAQIVAWRSKVFGLPYGDQGLLISRQFYERLGGFKAIPIMEDVELIRRIGRRRLTVLPAIIETSARRYQRSGYGLRALRNLACLSLYFCGLPPEKIVRLYGRSG